jgi:hypothetical protein
MQQRVFFDAWLNYINPTYNYNMRYKENYTTTITVNQYDVTNKLSYTINLFDAYPISMNQLDLDWNGEGYHKLSVTFAYTYWKNNSVQALGMELLDAGIDSLVVGLGGLGGTAAGTIGTGLNNMAQGIETVTVEK